MEDNNNENNNAENEIIEDTDKAVLLQTWNTFRAFVDAVIPRTPDMSYRYGIIQYYGALDSHTDEYMMMIFDTNFIPLTVQVADAIEAATKKFLLENGYPEETNEEELLEGESPFSRLPVNERFQVLNMLEEDSENIEGIPEYFLKNTGYLKGSNTTLNRFTLLGYYSEWSGYGNTRLAEPSRRVLEFMPIGWQQIGYPGPSLGYRALRI